MPATDTAIRLVHLEDDPNDRELVADVLRAEGIVCTVLSAASRESFEAALADPPDLILADFSLPGFDGISAQAIAAARWPDVPFVFVSGSIGEQGAVERLKSGATDYVLKDRIEKLPSAVRRAIREAEDRRHRELAETQLRELNIELAARVKERTSALMAANEQLVQARLEADKANRAKSEFIARMSHDLRTPLNVIMGFAQVLELDPLPADQMESVGHILRGGKHLLDLINEILDMARIEAGRLSLSAEPVAAAELVQSAIDLIRPLAAVRHLTLEVDVAPNLHVRADRSRLNQILFNLLSNAVKYNRERGTVRISTRLTPGRVGIVVSDTGAGIPPEKLALLFMPFERLGAEYSSVEGTGLGLALSKKLAEAMEGSMTVESVVDRGTAFCVELPASEPSAMRDTDGIETDLEDVNCHGTVLYIEDNAANLRLMQRLLSRRSGVTLLHAADGRSGIAMARDRRPDLVFLDLNLPDIQGEEVVQQIWADPSTRTIPVAVLSADATPALKRRLLATGATAYLTKPFDIREVLRFVDHTLGTRT